MRVARTTEAFPPSPSAAVSPTVESTGEETVGSVRSAAAETQGARATAPPAFVQVLRGLGQELDRGENITEKAIRGGGGHASPEQLIALQAGIYRYSEAVDLVTKVVDKGTQAVRTTLQNQ